MTLRDYLKIFRQRWWVILICTLLAGAVMFVVTPADASDEPPASSYTATATLLVGTGAGGGPEIPSGRIALFITTGEVPIRAAQQLGYTGDPVALARQVSVSYDGSAQALIISATHPEAQVAADRANTFAQAAIGYFTEVGTSTELTLLQEATPIPNMPTGGAVVPPSRGLRTAIGALVGLFLGLALAIVLDHLDARLRTRDEIHEATGLPVIAEIPKLPRSEQAAASIVVHEAPLGIYADGYRAARSALLHMSSKPLQFDASAKGLPGGASGLWGQSDQSSATYSPPSVANAKVIMITSALAGEGKTTSVANIAASFAETGQRVLVVDADLRSPNLHELFDVPQGAGVSDYLTRPEPGTLLALVRPTSVEGVGIITAGTQLEQPATLTSRMAPLIAAAREIADIVIVDASPILGASDGFDILPLVDTVLLVVRSGRLTATAAQRVAELLGRFHVPVAGVVVVAAPVSAEDGYGYGYGYGYGDKSKGRKKRSKQVTRSAGQPEAQPAGAQPAAGQPEAAQSSSTSGFEAPASGGFEAPVAGVQGIEGETPAPAVANHVRRPRRAIRHD